MQPLPAKCRKSRLETSTPHATMCVLLADGGVRTVSQQIALATSRAVITPAGGDMPGADW